MKTSIDPSYYSITDKNYIAEIICDWCADNGFEPESLSWEIHVELTLPDEPVIEQLKE